jgi:predicted DNA-binding transcriptional regulator YafY
MNIIKIIRIHELISSKQTGSPRDLALKVGISERMLYHYIAFMREELKAPIVYDSQNTCYHYDGECGLNFKCNSFKY